MLVSEKNYMKVHKNQALVGFQGRGCADGVPPDFCHDLLLEVLIFQWP